MTKQEEQQLVKDAQESLNAFNALYEYYLPKIYRYVLNRVGNKTVSEDITSQTFLKALKKLNTFNYTKSFGGWLYTIAHNNIIDFYRRNRDYSVTIEALETFLKTDDQTEKLAEKAELTKSVLSILRNLPESYQQVLSLRFMEERTNTEIAEVLGCSVNSVNVKIHRAIKSFENYVKKNNSELLELI